MEAFEVKQGIAVIDYARAVAAYVKAALDPLMYCTDGPWAQTAWGGGLRLCWWRHNEVKCSVRVNADKTLDWLDLLEEGSVERAERLAGIDDLIVRVAQVLDVWAPVQAAVTDKAVDAPGAPDDFIQQAVDANRRAVAVIEGYMNDKPHLSAQSDRDLHVIRANVVHAMNSLQSVRRYTETKQATGVEKLGRIMETQSG